MTSPDEEARYRRAGIWGDQTIYERFRAAADRFPDKLAVRDAKAHYTYADFRQLIDNLAGHLVRLGIGSGDVVAIQAPNWAELALLHLAANRIGALYLSLNDHWRAREVGHLLGLSGARLVIVPRRYREFDYPALIAELKPDLPSLAHVFAIGGAAPGAASFAELLAPGAASAAELAARRPHENAPAHIMLSSGTTSLPKISLWGGNDLLALLDPFAAAMDFGPEDVSAGLAPANTGATGYVFPLLTPLLHGATSVMMERWSSPAEAVALIIAHRCTYATAIPTQLTQMLPHLETQPPEAFAAFTRFNNAGAALPYDTGVKVEALMGCKVQCMYGTTDGGVPAMTTMRDPTEKRIGSVGKILPECECELWDEDSRPVLQGTDGEIVWRSPTKSFGYMNQPEETAKAFPRDRFYRSGDLGRIDADGYLYIVGRVKDMILRGGRNISPRTSEEALIKHPSVLEVSVAAMPDSVMGERACAFVVLRAGRRLSLDEMLAFLKAEEVGVFDMPERLEIMDELPRSTGGKYQKNKLTAFITEKLKAEGKVPA